MPFLGDMLVSWRVFLLTEIPARRKKYTEANWDFLCSYWSIGYSPSDVSKDIMIQKYNKSVHVLLPPNC